MKLSSSSLAMIFDKEHRTYSIAALVLVAALALSFILSFSKDIPYQALERYLEVGNTSQAIASGEAYLAVYPSDRKLIKILSEAYLMKALVPSERSVWVSKSRVLITRSGIDVETDAELMRLLGYGLHLIKNYDSADIYYQKAVTLSPKDALIWANMGQMEEMKGDLAKAESRYDKALSLDPMLDVAILGKVSIAIRKTNFNDALNLAEKHLLETSDRFVKAKLFEAIGIAKLRTGEILSATDSFAQAISFDQNLPVSLARYASLLLRAIPPNLKEGILERTEQPLSLAKKANALNPSESYALAVMSDIFFLRGDVIEAKKYAALVVASLPQSLLSLSEKRQLSEKYAARASVGQNVK